MRFVALSTRHGGSVTPFMALQRDLQGSPRVKRFYPLRQTADANTMLVQKFRLLNHFPDFISTRQDFASPKTILDCCA